MHKTINNLISIQNELKSSSEKDIYPKIIAVSKTFPLDSIQPLIDYGHCHFGENKVQEAVNKWSDIKTQNNDIKLHMIGRLQTNKVKYVVSLFDYIHSLDNIKLAEKISVEQKKINKNLKVFVQVNIGNESQKSGIELSHLTNFYNKCVDELKLNIVGYGSQLLKIQEYIENNNLKDLVQLHTNVSNTIKFYKEADLFILSSI